MPEPVLRRATAADVPAIGRVVAASFAKYVERIGKPPAPMLHDYAAVIARHRVWVLFDGGVLVGVLVNEVHGDHLLLDTIAVDPAAQGRGLGTVLLARAEADARELGLGEVRLFTNEKMTENQTFYPRHGYVETHRGQQDGYDRVFYAKRVADR